MIVLSSSFYLALSFSQRIDLCTHVHVHYYGQMDGAAPTCYPISSDTQQRLTNAIISGNTKNIQD